MPKTTSPSVERALDILEVLAQSGRPLSHSDISRRLDIPKSSASYLLRTLTQRGYLRRSTDGRGYQVGLKVLALGRSAVSGLDPRLGPAVGPILRELVDQTGLTGHLAILDDGRAVYVDRAERPGFIRINTWIGRAMNLHATGVGKVLATQLSTEEIHSILDRDGLDRMTVKTITSRDSYLAELKEVERRGYGVDDEENSLGVRCVAVPIFDQTHRLLASIGLSGATSQLPPESISTVAARMKEAAHRITQRLGGEPVFREEEQQQPPQHAP